MENFDRDEFIRQRKIAEESFYEVDGIFLFDQKKAKSIKPKIFSPEQYIKQEEKKRKRDIAYNKMIAREVKKQAKEDAAKEKDISKLTKILTDAGYAINILACGCCDSPRVELRALKTGKTIFKRDHCNIEMFKS